MTVEEWQSLPIHEENAAWPRPVAPVEGEEYFSEGGQRFVMREIDGVPHRVLTH